jgi:hypothetical protein
MQYHELTLASIDNHRHLTTSEEIVKAVAYAARRSGSDVTAYRFVTALVMADKLTSTEFWPTVLDHVLELQAVQED